MLDVRLSTVRLFLHVLAAAIWVGGQFTLAGLVGTLRQLGPEAPRLAARRFARIAWSAYAVLIVTGVWNLLAVGDLGSAWRTTIGVKLVAVLLSGVAAFVHGRVTSKRDRAIWGAVSALSALAALFLGVLLSG